MTRLLDALRALIAILAATSAQTASDASAAAAPADAGSLLQAAAARSGSRSGEAARHLKYIWAFYDYPKPNHWAELCIRTWRRHARGFEIRFVNDSNIETYVPDLPKEYYRVYDKAKSDLARAALLYHHGGVYMDTDFLMMGSLEPLWERLQTSDVVAYRTKVLPAKEGDNCGGDFASNLMAGRKGNAFSRTWWENLKLKLTRVCPPNGFWYLRTCCHEEGNSEAEHGRCHVPFTYLEHLKVPTHDHDQRGPAYLDTDAGKAPPGLEPSLLGGVDKPMPLPDDVRVKCMHGKDNYCPHANGEIYWMPWSNSRNATKLPSEPAQSSSNLYDLRFNCSEHAEGMTCARGNWGNLTRKFPNFFGRAAYHLFFTHQIKFQIRSQEEGLRGDWLLSELFRRSLRES